MNQSHVDALVNRVMRGMWKVEICFILGLDVYIMKVLSAKSTIGLVERYCIESRNSFACCSCVFYMHSC